MVKRKVMKKNGGGGGGGGRPKQSKGSNSVKLNNKKQNRQNLSNKKKKTSKKQLKNSLKNTELDSELINLKYSRSSFNANKKLAVDDEDGFDEINGGKPRRGNKRKLNEHLNDESIELNYKVKSSLIKEARVKNKLTFSLPIKTQTGKVVKNVKVYENEEEETGKRSDEDEYKEDEEKLEMIDERPKSFVEIIKEKKALFEQNKIRIARLSNEIIENPQGELKKLRELRQMLSEDGVKSSFILKNLIVVSMCEIFKDIVPSYKIRPWTEKENQQKIGKEVQELKSYEEGLVKQYKLYIDYLSDSLRSVHKTLFKNTNKTLNQSEEDAVRQYALVCLRSLGSLIENLSHFNFYNDIIEIIVHQLTSKISDLADLAAESIKKLFLNDKDLKLSLDIMQKIAKLLKQKSYGVKSNILDLFLSLRLKEIHIVEEKAKKLTHKEKMKFSRNERKKLKEKEQLENDLEEKKLSDRLRDKAKLQTRILEQMFVVYFNILKKAPNFKLIPSVLEGLAKFAHLINLDFFEDIIRIMHQMIESENLTLRSKLHCIKTVFIVLSGQGEALTIDPIKFYSSLYSIILQLNAAGTLENAYLLAECLDMMFLKRRKQIPTARLLAFIKRLTIVSLHLEPPSSAVILNLTKKLININKSSDLLFDNEYQDSGIYNPELNEPDYVNAQNSSLWEFHLLRRHYNLSIRFEANDMLKETAVGYAESKQSNEEIANKIIKEEVDILHSEIQIKKKNFK